MPYIEQDARDILNDVSPCTHGYMGPGELNYFLTKECLRYVKQKGESYTTYNAVIGVLQCMTQEIYRRIVAPYEDQKKRCNGEVFNINEVK